MNRPYCFRIKGDPLVAPDKVRSSVTADQAHHGRSRRPSFLKDSTNMAVSSAI